MVGHGPLEAVVLVRIQAREPITLIQPKNMENNNDSQKSITPAAQPQQIQPSKEYSDGFKRFMKAANPSFEPVTNVLRCHLLAEFHLDKLLIAALPMGDVIVDDERNRFMFLDKLLVVESLNVISKEIISSLRKLNTLKK